jgi:hypothetical protein
MENEGRWSDSSAHQRRRPRRRFGQNSARSGGTHVTSVDERSQGVWRRDSFTSWQEKTLGGQKATMVTEQGSKSNFVGGELQHWHRQMATARGRGCSCGHSSQGKQLRERKASTQHRRPLNRCHERKMIGGEGGSGGRHQLESGGGSGGRAIGKVEE